MIYLIDDKRLRQSQDYGWTNEKFNKYNDIIQPIYELSELEKRSTEIFQNGNSIFYHESFLDNTNLKNQASFKREKLDQFIKKNDKAQLVFFSGSKSVRNIDQRVASLPVSVFYENLEYYIQQNKIENYDLIHLLYGRHPQIEKELSQKLDQAIFDIDKEPAVIGNKNNLFIATDEKFIDNAIIDADERTLFFEETDEELHNLILEWLSDKRYDNIFLPLCFGSSLSDYNGLRLAMHLRCTETSSQVANIFIYAFVDLDELLHNPYFNILKTKNVQLVPFKKASFQKEVSKIKSELDKEQLVEELAKIKLDIPKSYEDNHSIANEWAIYRWSKHLSLETNDELDKVEKKIQSSLYFKYLKTTFPISQERVIPIEKLSIKKIGNPKVLLIDDEEDKGWNQLIAYLVTDLNNVYSDSIGNGFKTMESEMIIDHCLKKIKVEDIDIVILDFRLTETDFSITIPDQITSVKLIKKIKELNHGIQVIILSATNKIWNFQILQENGADGFITKETPEKSEGEYTSECINSFVIAINSAIKRVFLKKIFSSFKKIRKQLKDVEYEEETDYSDFIKDLNKHIFIIENSAKKISLKDPSTIDIVYLNCYNFLEKFKHYYIRERNYKQLIGIDEVEMNRYRVQDGIVTSEGVFIRNNRNDSPSWFHSLAGLFLDYFEICDRNHKDIDNLSKVKIKRNDYIHGSKNSFDRNELSVIVDLCLRVTSKLRE